MTIITLLTDYGIIDSYVAEVKGVILGINPKATIVDISHDVGNFDIYEGAFHMARSAPYFPMGTVHIGVVDPGVGSSRKGIIIECEDAYFVGPDNGLLAPAAERLGLKKLYEITNMELLPEAVSEVFDGRDVFGPTGALLSKGVPPEEIGEELDSYIRLPSYSPKVEGKKAEVTVIHIDNFGNCVLNVTYDVLSKIGVKENARFRIRLGDEELVLPYVRRFSAVPKGDPLLLVAGGGYIELSVNQGNASKILGLGKEEKLFLELL